MHARICFYVYFIKLICECKINIIMHLTYQWYDMCQCKMMISYEYEYNSFLCLHSLVSSTSPTFAFSPWALSPLGIVATIGGAGIFNPIFILSTLSLLFVS